MFYKNACSLEYCGKHLPKVEIFNTDKGMRGTCSCSDSNGAHAEISPPASGVRDTLFIEYTTERSDVWGCDIDAATVAASPGSPFDWLLPPGEMDDRPHVPHRPTWSRTCAGGDLVEGSHQATVSSRKDGNGFGAAVPFAGFMTRSAAKLMLIQLHDC